MPDAALANVAAPSLYFLHIPKTAGTSVRYWLFELFGQENWLPAHALDELAKFSRTEINSYSLYCGHFGFAIETYLDKLPRVVTWLRDPLSRVVSEYFYVINSYDYLVDLALQYGRQDWVEHYQFVRSSSLASLCSSPGYRRGADNLQTRYMARNCPEFDKAVVPVDDSMLAAAKQNIASIFCFGLCEFMDASTDLLCDRLAITNRSLTQHYNRGKSTFDERLATLSADDIATIRQANRFDEQLYEFARDLFELRVREFLTRKGVTAPAGDLLEQYGREPLKSAIRQAVDVDARNAA